MLKIYPPVYFLIFALLMWLSNLWFPLISCESSPYLASFFLILGLACDLIAINTFLRLKTTFNPFKIEQTSKLATTGLYKYSRNPMYLGLLLILIAWFFWLGSFSPIIWVFVYMWWLTKVQILREEQLLLEKFSDQYTEYQQSVSRWF